MYAVKIRRRRVALRMAAGAVFLGTGALLFARSDAAELGYTGPAYSVWGYAGDWSTNAVPTTGDVADLFVGQQVNYNIPSSSAVVLQAVQIAGGTASSPALLYMLSGTALDVSGGIYVGGSVTGLAGAAASGPGEIVESFGQVNLSGGAILEVDNSSVYQLGSSAQLLGSTELLSGIFSQTGSSSNTLAAGMQLINTGTYTLQNSAVLASDTITNSGKFNQSGATISPSTLAGATFNNSGSYVYNTGVFTGFMINNPGATISISGAMIPFSQGVLNNGLMTVTSVTGSYAGPISGSGTINYNGSSNITLTGTNPFNGSTGINAGTLTLAATGGGALQGNITLAATATLNFAANQQFGNATSLLINGGSVNLGSYNQSLQSLTLSGGQLNLSGTGSLGIDTVNSTGTFNQSGGNIQGTNLANASFNNSGSYLYTGGTFTGFLTNNPAATVTIAGSIIPFSQGILNNGLLTVTSATGTYAGTISGTGSTIFNGSQGVTLTGTDSFSGLTNIAGGTLTLAAPSGGALGGSITVGLAGSLVFGASSQFGSSASLITSGGVINLAAYNESLGSLALNGGQFNLTSAASLGADTITSTGTFNQSGASVQGTNSPYTGFNNSGTYLYSGGGFAGYFTNNLGATASISGSIIPFSQGFLNNGTLTVNSATGSYAGSIAGNGSLVFNGSQAVTLTGSNLFSGTTNIAGGTLTLATATGASLAGTITVGAAGTLAFGASSQFANNAALIINSGTVNLSGYNESVGSLTNNAGQFNLTASASLGADTILNTGVFNQSNSSVHGTNVAGTTFNNSGTYLDSNGILTGYFINNPGASVNISGGAIPFSQGILNNGLMTITNATGTYSGPISGNGTINFNGSQSVVLTNTSTFNGSTGIYGGSLTLAAPTGGALLGPLTVGTAGALFFGGNAQLTSGTSISVAGGTVNLAANNESIGSLSLTSGQFNLTGTGYLSATGEQIAGTFNQSNTSTNVLAANTTLNLSGNYLLQNSAMLKSDAVLNTGTFNQSGGTLQGVSSSTSSFNNSGTYLFSGGSFAGTVTNNATAVFNSSGGIFSGSVANSNGAQYLFSAGTFNGSLNNAGGAIATLSGGNFNASVTNNASGLLLLSGATVTGTVSNFGSYNASSGNASGTVINQPGASYLFAGGIFTGTVNNSTGSIYNATGGTSTAAVINNPGATVLYSGGTQTGSINNSGGAILSITNGSSGASVPFSAGILDNGQMTINGISATYSGPISGTGSIIFTGSQAVTLARSGSFTGSTSITGGVLTLAASSGYAVQGNIIVGAAGTLAFGADSQLPTTTALTINSSTVNLNSHNESIGTLIMNSGQINQPGTQPLDVVSGQVTIGKGSASIATGLRSNSSYNFNVANNATLAIAGPVSGATTNTSTGLVLTGGGGTLSIYGNSLLSSIDVSQGILQISEGGSLGGINLTTTLETGGSLSLNGQPLTIGDLLGSGAVGLGAGSLNVTSSATGSTFAGTINGTGSLIKTGSGPLTLTGSDAAGTTTVNSGTFTIASNASISSNVITSGASTVMNLNGVITGDPQLTANGTVNIAAGATAGIRSLVLAGLNIGPNSTSGNGQVNVAAAFNHSSRTLVVTAGLFFTGALNGWSGQLDLANNDMVVQNGNLATLTNLAASGFNVAAGGNWKGNGIVSSSAAGDTTHLTTLGVIQNNNGSSQPLYGSSAPLGTFDGYNPAVGNVLIKYTYFGDANLDGKIDGSDYSLIDYGYLNHLTGWYNGDFNYDGVVDGSDYTLMDNAFNTQGASLADLIANPNVQLADPTAQIADPTPTGIPEPTALGSIALLSVCLGRRSRR